MTDKTYDKFDLAITKILTKSNWLFEAMLLSDMDFIKTEEIKTAATDCYKKVWYNPDFFSRMTINQCCGVLVHEAFHAAQMHSVRRKFRDPQLWNIACDYEVNYQTVKSGHDLPGQPFSIDKYIKNIKQQLSGQKKPLSREDTKKDAIDDIKDTIHLYDETLGEMSAEQIYQKIIDESGLSSPENMEKMGRGQVTIWVEGDVFGDDTSPAEDGTGGDGPSPEDIMSDIQDRVLQAAEACRQAGVNSANHKLLVDMHKDESVDWKQVLRRFITQHTRHDDFSFARPRRRALMDNIVMPSMRSEGAGTIAVFVDTSGSCHHALKQFGAEMSAIAKQVKPERLLVLYVDYDICHVDDFTNMNDVKFEFHGGGGTSFVPPFDWMKKEKIKPDCAIYLTDLYGGFPDYTPSYPTIWAITSDGDKNTEPPFGVRTEVKIDDNSY